MALKVQVVCSCYTCTLTGADQICLTLQVCCYFHGKFSHELCSLVLPAQTFTYWNRLATSKCLNHLHFYSFFQELPLSTIYSCIKSRLNCLNPHLPHFLPPSLPFIIHSLIRPRTFTNWDEQIFPQGGHLP